MLNNLQQDNGGDIRKPFEPDITKGLTVTNAPTKPVPPPPPPPQTEE